MEQKQLQIENLESSIIDCYKSGWGSEFRITTKEKYGNVRFQDNRGGTDETNEGRYNVWLVRFPETKRFQQEHNRHFCRGEVRLTSSGYGHTVEFMEKFMQDEMGTVFDIPIKELIEKLGYEIINKQKDGGFSLGHECFYFDLPNRKYEN